MDDAPLDAALLLGAGWCRLAACGCVSVSPFVDSKAVEAALLPVSAAMEVRCIRTAVGPVNSTPR